MQQNKLAQLFGVLLLIAGLVLGLLGVIHFFYLGADLLILGAMSWGAGVIQEHRGK